MDINLKLTQRMTQQLRMTPQLQQAIKLLQLSRTELTELVQNEMLENPVLEDQSEGDAEVETPTYEPATEEMPEFTEKAMTAELVKASEQEEHTAEPSQKSQEMDWADYFENYSVAPPLPSQSGGGEELPSIESTLSTSSSLFDHLLWQINLSAMSRLEREIATRIIGNLDERGYFPEGMLAQLAEDEYLKSQNVMLEEIEDVLQQIQEFDPIGVAARSLSECLMVQARHIGCLDEDMERILRDHIPNLEKKNYQVIARDLKLSLQDVVEYAKIITNLNPRPGRNYATDDTQYITPDVYVHKIGDKYFVVSNDDGLPKLRVSRYYRQALHQEQHSGTKDYIQDKLRSAQWLIRSIQQRQRTIIKVTESIIKFQREFFDKGVSFLRPLILKDVADDIRMHESTVSRVTTNKYVHTPQGIFELKYFFNAGINRVEDDKIASESVKSRIKQIIAQEDPRHPYSDQEIVDLLLRHDIDIARRTVAKYREMLGILPSSRRKKLF